jgi:hypothetical protein
MRIKRSYLEQIVKEELLAMMRETDDDEDGKKKDKKPEPKSDAKPKVSKGDASADVPEPPPADKQPKNIQDPVGDVPPPDANGAPEEPVDTGDDMADDDLEDDSDEEGSELAAELSGKVLTGVQDVKKSKTLPGARELVLTFKDSNQPLRVLIMKSGIVKFLYKGKVHNEI